MVIVIDGVVIVIDGFVVIVIEGIGMLGSDEDMLCVTDGTVIVMLGIAVDIEPDVSAPASIKSYGDTVSSEHAVLSAPVSEPRQSEHEVATNENEFLRNCSMIGVLPASTTSAYIE